MSSEEVATSTTGSPVPSRRELERAFLRLMATPAVASKRWAAEQVDEHGLGSRETLADDADAAVLGMGVASGAVQPSGLAVSTHCDVRYCRANAHLGAAITLVEGTRGVSCVGAVPTTVTGSIGIGAAEDAAAIAAFRAGVSGLGEACREMHLSVAAGGVAVCDAVSVPAPTVAVMGRIADAARAVGEAFVDEEDVIVLVGETKPELGGSEYLASLAGSGEGRGEGDGAGIPGLDFDLERRVEAFVRDAIDRGLVKGAHSCSVGGVATALAECAIKGDMGCDVSFDDDLEPEASLFSETQSRILVTVSRKDSETLADALDESGLPYTALGNTGGGRITIDSSRGHHLIDIPLEVVADAYDHAIERLVESAE